MGLTWASGMWSSSNRDFPNEQPFKIYGHDQTRSFNYVDAVEGTVLALENGVGQAGIYWFWAKITIKELTKYVGDMMGYQGDYVNAETFPGSVSRRFQI